MHTTRQLAQYVHELEADSLSPEVVEAALRCVLDLVACAAAGLREPSVAASRTFACSQYPGGPAEVWFSGERATATGAVFANAAAASVLDLDDGFRTARGHPGAAVIPAAFATAAEVGASGREILAAIVAGYEVSVRVGRSRHWYANTGVWSPYGAIAAAGRLRRTRPECLAHALAMGAQCAPVLKGKGGGPQFESLSGSDVKEGIPWGAQAGMTALYLAEAGATGALEILDSKAQFMPERITEGLGGVPLIGGTYFKPHACCRHIHAPLDAFDQLLEEHRIAVDDIEHIEVHTYSGTFNINNLARPPGYVDVQFSVPYCLAIRALRGLEALVPIPHDVVGDEALARFAEKVSLHPDAAIEARFPAESLTRVVITTGSGRYESPVTTPRGDPGRALSWAQLEQKLRVASRHVLPVPRQDALIGAVRALGQGDFAPLRRELAAAAP